MSVRALVIFAAVFCAFASRADSHDDAWPDRDHDMTIRVVSTAPFLFQRVDRGTRRRARWFDLAISSAIVDAKLAALPFGAVVRVHYQAPPTMNSVPPPHLTAIGPARAAEPALVADWRSEHDQIQIYADGHALVTAPPHPLIDMALSSSELDAVMTSFTRTPFDALAQAAPDHRVARVILLRDRYQQVDLAGHTAELAPIAAAFAHVRDQTLARARPLLRIEDTGWHPRIFTWPADAPPLTNDWYSLRFTAAQRAAAGDDASPIYRALPRDLAAALGGPRRVIVHDHGVWWSLGLERCDACRAGTYASLSLELESWHEAPDWAPDFLGATRLWLDGRDPRLGTLDRYYLQRGELFEVWQTEAIPPPTP